MKILLNKDNALFDFGNDIVFAKGGAPDGGLQECSEAEATHIWNREKNTACMNNGEFTMAEVAEIPAEVKIEEYKYVDGAFVINIPVKKAGIIRELEELDVIINRATEDLYKATGTTPYANVQETISKKEELRVALANLES